MSDEQEQWKPWPRDTWYEVSNMGNVRVAGNGRLLKYQFTPGKKRPFIETRHSGRAKVARMVWEAWRGISSRVIGHADGNHLNNSVDNLRETKSAFGGASAAKIRGKAIATVVARYLAGDSMADIAKSSRCSEPTVYNAIRRAGVAPENARQARREARREAGKAAATVLADEAIAIYRTGLSWSEVAASLGISHASLTKRLNNAGHSGRHLGRARKESDGWVVTQQQASALGLTMQQAEGKAKNLRRNYGLTLGEYIAIKVRQRNKCAACRKPLGEERTVENANSLGGRFPVVDHCHKTEHQRGSVRGILHATCNSMLGMAREDREVLRRLGQYLDATRTERPMGVANAVQCGLDGL